MPISGLELQAFAVGAAAATTTAAGAVIPRSDDVFEICVRGRREDRAQGMAGDDARGAARAFALPRRYGRRARGVRASAARIRREPARARAIRRRASASALVIHRL